MAKRKPNQGARKTETLTLRLDPKIKTMIELIARIRRQSITGVVESAIEDVAFDLEAPYFDGEAVYQHDLGLIFAEVWSADECERFINMCFHLPTLLTFEEQRIWETIKASPAFHYKPTTAVTTDWEIERIGPLDLGMLRRFWEDLLEHVAEHKDSKTIVVFEPPF